MSASSSFLADSAKGKTLQKNQVKSRNKKVVTFGVGGGMGPRSNYTFEVVFCYVVKSRLTWAIRNCLKKKKIWVGKAN